MFKLNPSVPERTGATAGRKSNKTFMILSALGILFVVNAHLGHPIPLLIQIFPYDSFYMPMFAFISGYFFKESHRQSFQSVVRYSIQKFRRLFLPYLIWVLFYNILSDLLLHLGLWKISGLSLRELIYGIVTTGVTSAFNSPAWFAPLLFCVCIAYCLIRWLFRRFWNDHIALVLFIAAGAAAVWLSGTDFNTPLHYMLLKVPFFLQFYFLGLYFHRYWEASFDRLGAIPVCAAAALINGVLICRYGNTIEFPICSSMSGFLSGNPLLPLLTSVTGTAFWLKISGALVPILGQNRLVNYISENTFFIMTHHIGVKHLFIGLCLLSYRLGMSCFSGIDVEQFLSDGLYLYSAHPWCAPACFLFSVVILLLGCRMLDSLKHHICVQKQP